MRELDCLDPDNERLREVLSYRCRALDICGEPEPDYCRERPDLRELGELAMVGCLAEPLAEAIMDCLAEAPCDEIEACFHLFGDDKKIPEECGPACDKVVSCGGEELDECLRGCARSHELFTPEAWEEAGACIEDTPCVDVPENDDGVRDLGEHCTSNLACVDAEGASVTAIWQARCLARVRCGQAEAADCVGLEAPDDLGMFACFRQEVVAEVLGCIGGAACDKVDACLKVFPGDGEGGGAAPDPEPPPGG